jgi:hypothetical protein
MNPLGENVSVRAALFLSIPLRAKVPIFGAMVLINPALVHRLTILFIQPLQRGLLVHLIQFVPSLRNGHFVLLNSVLTTGYSVRCK